MRKTQEKKGITLISLVITIIVLLILAAVAITLAVDSDGLFTKAGDAANKWNTSVGSEQTTLQNLLDMADEIGKVKPGLYETGTENLSMSWEELKTGGLITVSGTTLQNISQDLEGDLVIPDEIESLATYASVDWCCTAEPEGALMSDHSLTGIVIPDSITSIPDNAFANFTDLINITIPNSVISIGENAFRNTAWYDGLPNGDVYINNVYYKYKGTMPENTSISINDGTISVSGRAFYDCTGLVGVIIPNSVKEIGKRAFFGCSNMVSVTIPISVTKIGSQAFVMGPETVINCVADTKPDGWHAAWGGSNNLNWGYDAEEI